jgi:hypothetical protein
MEIDIIIYILRLPCQTPVHSCPSRLQFSVHRVELQVYLTRSPLQRVGIAADQTRRADEREMTLIVDGRRNISHRQYSHRRATEVVPTTRK